MLATVSPKISVSNPAIHKLVFTSTTNAFGPIYFFWFLCPTLLCTSFSFPHAIRRNHSLFNLINSFNERFGFIGYHEKKIDVF